MPTYGIVNDVASQLIRDVLPSLLMKNIHRPTLYRIQQLLNRLINGDRVTAVQMARDLEVSLRTITRDIDYLINTLHVPMAYDYHKRSYVLSGPIPVLFSLPTSLPSEAQGDDIVTVVMEVDDDLAEHLNRIVVHPSQERSVTDEGVTRITIRVPPSDALVQWVLGFGGRLRIVEPAPLRQRVLEGARAILKEH